MNSNEVARLKTCSDEQKLRELTEEIGDKISFRGYSKDQVIDLVEELLKIDLLSLEYATRETILNVLCDSLLYYDIRNELNFGQLSRIKDRVETDLKEYIEEIVGE